jgi:hypothetical protein
MTTEGHKTNVDEIDQTALDGIVGGFFGWLTGQLAPEKVYKDKMKACKDSACAQ